MKLLLQAILMLLFFPSCEKAISFNLKQSPLQVVVDASIENGKPPTVVLSRSLDYFSKISPSILESSFVHNAVITVSNGAKAQQLKEYSMPADTTGYTLYYYSIDSSNLANAFLGEFNTAYDLKIEAGGQTYTAQTHITSLRKKIDALSWQDAPDNPDTTKAVIVATITDPPGYGDYTRYYTSVNDSAFYPALNSVFDDQITDGTTFNIELEKGVNRNQKIDLKNYSFFTKGDTVIVKYCNIDKATYDFWRTMEYDYQSIGNPFSSPTTVLGNISNGALGAFCGYAAQYYTIIIPK
ncbi:MAG: DUF4249 domain-containing protein [Bacteroidetes bacterium]|nr:DUF4249 domain-containing protein [Bacteroidota bacterium]MBS1975190.1 DUF4249 domain-containing protein [Bacteroidota bacterium]